jgi:hypothetical protein
MGKKYIVYEKTARKKKCDILLALVVCIMLIAYVTSQIEILSAQQHSVIECICFIVAAFVCFHVFSELYYKRICDCHDKLGWIFGSQYIRSKYSQTSRISHYIPFIGITVCLSDVVITLLYGADRETFSLLMLLSQFLYYLFLVVYKGYFLDLIVLFGDQSFLSGQYVVRYASAAEVREIKRTLAMPDTVVSFELLNEESRVIVRDKFVLSDFLLLKQYIDTQNIS